MLFLFSIHLFNTHKYCIIIFKEYKDLADKVRTFYFGKNGTVNKTSFSKYMDMLSDLWFAYGIDKAAKLQAKQSNGKTFLYK